MRTGVLVGVGVLALGACGGSTQTGGADAGPDYVHCVRNDDCVIRPASCCGACGAATRGDVIAVEKTRAALYASDHCAGVGCPACYAEPDPTLLATCVDHKCAVVDLLAHDSTSCSADGDCRIRTTSCCECNGATDRAHLVAVSSEVDFSPLVCDGQACPECAPLYPVNVSASCNESGHCVVVW